MKSITLIFPHQLFEKHPAISINRDIFLVEEFLFFRQCNFHKQKLHFHRASMKAFESFLVSQQFNVNYINAFQKHSDIRQLIPFLTLNGVTTIHLCETDDSWLTSRLKQQCLKHNIELIFHPSQLFINSQDEILAWFANQKRYHQTDFYIHERKKRNLLLDENRKPLGGKWTFDSMNRKKFPKNDVPPFVQFSEQNLFHKEAADYVEKHFSSNIGQLSQHFVYPTTYEESKLWLQQFLQQRFYAFGDFEDAISVRHTILHHSVLTPMMNVGLISPQTIVEEAIRYANQNNVSLNSLEGFVRQIVGWREFIRGLYHQVGTQQRTQNYWGFKRKIPTSFYQGNTGIEPVDHVIKQVLKTGYCHHIERLMVLGNFMLLCEFDPDEVYRWFMELFIDAYDWVMVPNVYGMSQFADGGLMATKPYISGSNYILKMSDFSKGEWTEIWDSLFWRFMHVHRDFFLQNPRLGMLVRQWDKKPDEKRNQVVMKAEMFLKSLDS